jgi:hypothetical protein
LEFISRWNLSVTPSNLIDADDTPREQTSGTPERQTQLECQVTEDLLDILRRVDIKVKYTYEGGLTLNFSRNFPRLSKAHYIHSDSPLAKIRFKLVVNYRE